MPFQTVLLINPNRMKPVVSPIALDYLGHALKKAGYGVDVLDLHALQLLYWPAIEFFRCLIGLDDVALVGVDKQLDGRVPVKKITEFLLAFMQHLV